MQVDIPLNLRYGAIALFFIGPAVLIIAGLGAISEWDKQSWPEAAATVLKNDIEVSKSPTGFSLKGRTRYADYFTAQCTFAYEVNGERFTETAACAKDFDRAEVERNARPYAAGNQITIHYSPRRPGDSILRKEADIAGLSIGFCLGGLAIPLGLVLRRIARNIAPELPADLVPRGLIAERATPLETKQHSEVQLAAVRQRVETSRFRGIYLMLRGIAVCAGVVLVLFGGLAVAVCIHQIINGTEASGKADVDVAVRVVALILLAFLTVFGAFLIWIGLRRSRSVRRSANAVARPSQKKSASVLSLPQFKRSSLGT